MEKAEKNSARARCGLRAGPHARSQMEAKLESMASTAREPLSCSRELGDGYPSCRLAVPLSLLLSPQSGSTAGELRGNLHAKLENQDNLEEWVLHLQS